MRWFPALVGPQKAGSSPVSAGGQDKANEHGFVGRGRSTGVQASRGARKRTGSIRQQARLSDKHA